MPHELVHIRGRSRISATYTMPTKQPQVPAAAHRHFRNLRQFVGRILLWIDEITHKGVELGSFETRDVDVEVTLRKQHRELAQFGGKSGAVPAGVEGDPILSERKSALFQFRQMRELNHGHELQSELTRDLVAKMAGESAPARRQ